MEFNMEEMIAQCTQLMQPLTGMMTSMGSMMGGSMMQGGMMSGMMAPLWILGWALAIAVAAVLVLAIVWAVRRSGSLVHTSEAPVEILKRRYARGEIPADQYETMKQQLSGD